MATALEAATAAESEAASAAATDSFVATAVEETNAYAYTTPADLVTPSLCEAAATQSHEADIAAHESSVVSQQGQLSAEAVAGEALFDTPAAPTAPVHQVEAGLAVVGAGATADIVEAVNTAAAPVHITLAISVNTGQVGSTAQGMMCEALTATASKAMSGTVLAANATGTAGSAEASKVVEGMAVPAEAMTTSALKPSDAAHLDALHHAGSNPDTLQLAGHSDVPHFLGSGVHAASCSDSM